MSFCSMGSELYCTGRLNTEGLLEALVALGAVWSERADEGTSENGEALKGCSAWLELEDESSLWEPKSPLPRL